MLYLIKYIKMRVKYILIITINYIWSNAVFTLIQKNIYNTIIKHYIGVTKFKLLC